MGFEAVSAVNTVAGSPANAISTRYNDANNEFQLILDKLNPDVRSQVIREAHKLAYSNQTPISSVTDNQGVETLEFSNASPEKAASIIDGMRGYMAYSAYSLPSQVAVA